MTIGEALGDRYEHIILPDGPDDLGRVTYREVPLESFMASLGLEADDPYDCLLYAMKVNYATMD